MKLKVSGRKLVLGCVMALSLTGCGESTDPTQVAVTGGVVQGVKTNNVIAFKGIPFAAPPVGDLRWRAPQAVQPWEGVLDANDYGNDCMQLPFPSDAAPLGKTPAEDCLYVNVWKPADANENTPVLVWFYGGGYVNGGASPAVYNGEHFAESGVIFVSFNYRLGRFGFFAHPALTEEAKANNEPTANFAVMDQVTALHWVKNNIAAFGGDPSQVTIIGESAGGDSVLTMMQTAPANGLFQRAVIMSGGGRSLTQRRVLSKAEAGEQSAEAIGENFAEAKGISASGAEALAALRELSGESVVDGYNLATMFAPPAGGKTTYVGGPVQDGELITGSIQSALENDTVADVDVMVGATSMDIGFNAFPDKASLFASYGEFAEAAEAAYDPTGDAPLQLVGYMAGQDRMMQEPARFVATQMTQSGQQAYYYRFGYVADSLSNEPGAAHASDIPFFFKTVDAKYGAALTPKDAATSAMIHQYVANFAKTGNPNGEGLATWEAFDPATSNMMDFNRAGEGSHAVDPWKARLDVVAKAASR